MITNNHQHSPDNGRDVIRHSLRRRVNYGPMMRRTRPGNVPDTTAMSDEESWAVILEAGRKIVEEGVDVACEGCPDNMEMYAVIQYLKSTEEETCRKQALQLWLSLVPQVVLSPRSSSEA